MANTFKNYTSTVTDAVQTTIYTVPASTTSVIIGLNLANTSTAQITVSVRVAGTHIIKDAPIPSGAALSVLDGKIIAEAADVVTVQSSASSGDLDVILSVLEQT